MDDKRPLAAAGHLFLRATGARAAAQRLVDVGVRPVVLKDTFAVLELRSPPSKTAAFTEASTRRRPRSSASKCSTPTPATAWCSRRWALRRTRRFAPSLAVRRAVAAPGSARLLADYPERGNKRG